MTNIYRKIFYSIIILIVFLFILATILLGALLENKIPTIVIGIITVYIANGGLALWISTSNVRMLHTKLAWLLSFLVFPIISNIIYLIWGRMPYYAKTALDFKEEYKDYLKYYNSKQKNINNDSFDLIAQYVNNMRKSTVFSNNNIKVIKNNVDFFDNIIKLIKSANKTILMCYYIIDNGRIWQAVRDNLIKKANEGVQIHILFDRYGSSSHFKHKMLIELLKHPNINISKFESAKDVKTRSANNFRSHKKVLIIDNDVVLYGGSNLADEYIATKYKYPNWNDLNFVIRGPIVKSFLIDFCIDWDFNSFLPYVWSLGDYFHCSKPLSWLHWLRFKTFSIKKQETLLPIIKNRSEAKKIITKLESYGYFNDHTTTEINDENKAIFFQTGPRYYNNIVTDTLLTAFLNAKKSIKIISPYLQLNDSLSSALIISKQRNVKVEILTAGSCDDKWFLLDMNRSIYPKLVDANIDIYEYSGFIHSKLVIIDDKYILSGTFNMDYRSFNSNFETVLMIQESNTLREVNEYWENTILYSKKYTKYDVFMNKSFKSIFVQTGLQIIQPLL